MKNEKSRDEGFRNLPAVGDSRREPESEELLTLRRQTPNGKRILACDRKLFKFSQAAVVNVP